MCLCYVSGCVHVPVSVSVSLSVSVSVSISLSVFSGLCFFVSV